MIDEMGSRLWVEHHKAFGEAVDRAIARVRSSFGHFAGWDGTTAQLIALTGAFLLTALNISFSSSVA